MDVVLIDYARDPLEKLYGAYRTCYSAKAPREVWDDIKSGTIAHEKVRAFVAERLKTGHVSPLEQVVFWFGLSGVSRALSHQLVRHRIGISFEQQSQRYVKYKDASLEYVTPETWAAAGKSAEYEKLMVEITRVYEDALKAGIPAEDARFILPNATPTNFQIMVNFAELLHIGDLRLCTRAQWEIRKLVAKMRTEVVRNIPEIGGFIQPKCGERRLGYCDEDLKSWEACPLGKVRPHKAQVLEAFKQFRRGGVVDLTDEHMQQAEDFREPIVKLGVPPAAAST